MNAIHNAKSSQFIAVAVTVILEILFAFLGGWTLYDTFASWGDIPAIIIGSLVGLTLLLLYLYVFIFREYALDAVKVFSAKRGEHPGSRLMWAGFLAFACITMDSFFNANRMLTLPSVSPASKICMWVGLQMLVFIPFALGKVVHAHINTVNVAASRQHAIANKLNSHLYNRIEEVLPTLDAPALLALKAGDMSALHARMNAVDAEKQELTQPETDPFAQALANLGNGSQPKAPRQR